jgi:DNA-binding LacI/PurR family transcriptional regulator
MQAKRPTSFDIAELAGVSQSTVSRALRGDSMVSEDTRLRVERAAQKLNYKVDVNARNLRSQRTSTLALLLYEDPRASDSLINPFFLAILSSVTRAAARRGYDVLVSFQQASADWNADYAASKRADGIIFLGYGDYTPYLEKIRRLDEAGIRHITWGPAAIDQPGRFIGSDNRAGGREATAHLLRQGRRAIAFLGDISEDCPEFRDRHQGYADALAAAGITPDPTLRVGADASEDAGYAAACALITAGSPFDALFAACDLIAIGALRALRDHGIEAPKQVAIVGFDDIHAASCTAPTLTTMHQDTEAAGELLVGNLLRLMQGQPVEHAIIPTRLIVRASCGGAGR